MAAYDPASRAWFERGRLALFSWSSQTHGFFLPQTPAPFALIGPRTLEEIRTSLPGLVVGLTAEEWAWLDLERDDR